MASTALSDVPFSEGICNTTEEEVCMQLEMSYYLDARREGGAVQLARAGPDTWLLTLKNYATATATSAIKLDTQYFVIAPLLDNTRA